MSDERDVSTLSFEDALRELEGIVSRLETGQEDLQTAIDLYARGDLLRAQCTARLDASHGRIEAIRIDAEGRPSTQPFDAQ